MIRVTKTKEDFALDQEGFPALPPHPQNEYYIPVDNRIDYRLRLLISVIYTTLSQKGSWQPLTWSELVSETWKNLHASVMLGGHMGSTLNKLAQIGDIKLKPTPNNYYIIPTPKLAEHQYKLLPASAL